MEFQLILAQKSDLGIADSYMKPEPVFTAVSEFVGSQATKSEI